MTNPLPPVLLLHGWGGSVASTFAATGWLEALAAQGRKVLARNLPGHGHGASADPRDYADLVGQIVADLPPHPVDVVGYSLGAKLALAIAGKQPDRIRRIVVGGVGDNIFAAEQGGEAIARALDDPSDGNLPEQVAALARHALENGNDRAAMAAILRRPANPLVDSASLPGGEGILLFNSTADTVAMPDDRLRTAMPDCRYIAVSRIGHLDIPADPSFKRKALEFLA